MSDIPNPELSADTQADSPVDPKVDPEIASEVEAEAADNAAAAAVAETESAPVPKPVDAPEPAPAEPEESFGEIFSEFQRTHSRREDGSQIRGTVIAVTADSVIVDIGFKSEGILPLTAFAAQREPVKPGDALMVSSKGRGEDGYYHLSLFRTAVPKDWSGLEKAFAEKTAIPANVIAVVKGGLQVDLGVRGFVPASRSGARDAAEMEKLVGEEILVRITKLDVENEDVVADRRVVLEEEALASRARRQAEIAEGAVLDGTVRSITGYGAFVDLGGVDGLLHISDIAWSRVADVNDVLNLGQQIEVKVLKVDAETRKISLGMKQLQPQPWDAVPEKYAAGQRIRGVVTRIADFGAFVELEPGVEGLVHLSEMSWSKRIHKATEVVKVGDVVDAVVLSISVPERRISLGLKQALGDPWADAAARLTAGSVVDGPIASITKFGAFVRVSEGVEGMVHISEIVADRRLNHPSDVLHIGQVVRAVVLGLDAEKRQLRLSMKQLIPTSLDEFLAEHKTGDTITGRVASVENGVAVVDLGEGIRCMCKLPAAPSGQQEPETKEAAGKIDLSAFSSMLASKWKTGSASMSKAKSSEAVGAGQVRSFQISRIDTAAKLIDVDLLQ